MKTRNTFMLTLQEIDNRIILFICLYTVFYCFYSIPLATYFDFFLLGSSIVDVLFHCFSLMLLVFLSNLWHMR